MNGEQKELYRATIDLWQCLCDLHQRLYECTTNEYNALLSSELEKTEEYLKKKKNIINKINIEEQNRQKLIEEILGPKKLSNEYRFSDLKAYFNQFEIEKEGNHLNNFNLILMDTIKKIRQQNKKNQLFLNRAMLSLEGLKLPLGEKSSLSLYNKKGKKLKKVDLKEV